MTNTTYRTRAEIVREALDNDDAVSVIGIATSLDHSDLIEAAQVLVDQGRFPGWVQGARVFGALFGIRNEEDAMGMAETIVEWDRGR